jgi:hypothetical protein
MLISIEVLEFNYTENSSISILLHYKLIYLLSYIDTTEKFVFKSRSFNSIKFDSYGSKKFNYYN